LVQLTTTCHWFTRSRATRSHAYESWPSLFQRLTRWRRGASQHFA
jgi:hypothetical protein